jgi:hypothetical protein
MCNQCDNLKNIALQQTTEEELIDAVQRVKSLHRAVQGPYDNLVCEECSHMNINIDFHTDYPCLTIKALDGETK